MASVIAETSDSMAASLEKAGMGTGERIYFSTPSSAGKNPPPPPAKMDPLAILALLQQREMQLRKAAGLQRRV
jgi:hypothetical protein